MAGQECEMHLGTSGFSFDDWKGTVYPETLPKPQWLIYYEQQLGFNALEVNYTYYAMPTHRTMQGLVRKTSERFRFTVKTHRSMTHDILQTGHAIQDNPMAFEQFREGLQPMTDSGKLGCVLAQFPYAFFNKPETREYVVKTIDRLSDLNLVLEFRNKSWTGPKTLESLAKRGVGFCIVDEPFDSALPRSGRIPSGVEGEPPLPQLMPWVPAVTSETGYIRFHGRNAEQWFGTTTEERYNYLYSDTELRELVQRVKDIPEKVQRWNLFFNNCHAGAAAKNARRFKELLLESGITVAF